MSDTNSLDSPFLHEELRGPESFVVPDRHLELLVQQSPFAALDIEAERDRQSQNTPVTVRLGKPDYWPDVVYIVKSRSDSFLNSASQFHKLWGLKVLEFENLEGLIEIIAKAAAPGRRVRIVSHAMDGFMIPLFKGSPADFGITQTQIEALNQDDGALMDQFLETLTNLTTTTDQGVAAWKALLQHLEASSPAVLTPFKFSSGKKPTGDSEILLRRCGDLVAVARADQALSKAVRTSIAGAVSRLRRSQAEGNALADAVRLSGFTFRIGSLNADYVQRIRAAVGALDNRAFQKSIKDAQAKLKDKWVDFRGCRLGSQLKYLEAFAILMGAAGCTAPDWWSGYPGEAPIRHTQVATASAFARIISSSTHAEAAMNRWGARELSGWSAGDSARFFDEYLKAGNGVLPVYEPDYSGTKFREKHTLYWNSRKGKQRWLESMWDGKVTKQAAAIAVSWGSNTPRMPALALHLKGARSTTSNPQKIFVAPEPEFRSHIIEVAKP